MPKDINRHNCPLFYFFHRSLFIQQSRAHQICSIQQELQGPAIGYEFGVHVGIAMDDSQRRNAVIINRNEMRFFIHDDMLSSFILPGLHFISHNFGLLREKYLNLCFWEFRPFDQASPVFFNSTFTGNLLMTSSFYPLQHISTLLQLLQAYYFKLKNINGRAICAIDGGPAVYKEGAQCLEAKAFASPRYRLEIFLVEMEVTKEEILELKRTIQRLTQTNNRLSNDNRHLNDQKESILTEYTNEVSQIKQEIAYKQQEIIQLKELASPSKIDQQLALRQIKYDLNESFQSQISTKEQRIQELSSFIQKMKYERQIEQEKSRLKMSSLQVSIIEIKKLHDQQIRQYSNKVHFLQHPKTGSDKQHLKRLKRQNDQLHIQIQLLNKDLNSILQEKNKQIKDYNSYMNDYKKNVVNHSKEIEVYKEEIQRLRMKQDREMVDKNQHVVKDREREMKRLKSQIELIRDEMIDKDRKISDLQVQKVRLNNEIKLIRSERHKYEQVFEDNMQKDRQHLSGELKTAYINIDKLRAQNQELHEKIHDHSIHNNKKYQHTRQEEQPPKKTITREKQQKEQVEDNSPIKYITEMKEKHFHTTTEKHYIQDNKNRYEQRNKEYEEVILQEQGKLKEFLVKYVDLKKKNQNLEKKLTKANEKLVELLKNKIVLGSPKATTNKHFEFPQNGHQNSPPKHHEKQSKDKYKYKNLHLNTDEQAHVNYSPNFKNQVNNHNNHHTKASHHLNGSQTNQKNQYSRTNPAMIRNFLSPQQQRNILIQDNQNEHSYYDRSFKIKKSVNKLTDVKCLNHDHEHYHQEDGHRQLSGN